MGDHKAELHHSQDSVLATVHTEADSMRKEIRDPKTTNSAMQAQLAEIIDLLNKQTYGVKCGLAKCGDESLETAGLAPHRNPPSMKEDRIQTLRDAGDEIERDEGGTQEAGAGRDINRQPQDSQEGVPRTEANQQCKPSDSPPVEVTLSQTESMKDRNAEARSDSHTNTARQRPPGSPKIHDPLNTRRRDSVTQHVDRERFFGPKWVAIRRVGSAENAEPTLNSWGTSSAVQHFVIHLGINEVRNQKEVSETTESLKNCMCIASQKCPRASVIYSEIIYAGDSRSTEANKAKEINRAMKAFCEGEDRFVYVEHLALRGNAKHFQDNVHINQGSGTRSLVADITGAVRKQLANRGDGIQQFRGVGRINRQGHMTTEAKPYHPEGGFLHTHRDVTHSRMQGIARQ